MPTPKEETAVTAWLKYNQADQFIDAFYEQGYYQVENVDPEAINSIVKGKPGLATALKNSLAERKKRQEAPAMAPPQLPAGTKLDLSADNLKTSDGMVFNVPRSLSVESTNAAIKSPGNIKREEWMVIAKDRNLLRACKMDGVMPEDHPQYAKRYVLDWMVPASDEFAQSEYLWGEVTSTLIYSDEAASFVASGFDTQTATAGYVFCAASFARSHKEKTAQSSEKKTLIQVGVWKYPRVKIYLDQCTVPSEGFITAVRNALAQDDKFGKLKEVFDNYGHVVPSSVLLGGMLRYKETRVDISVAQEHAVETELKAAVEGKLGQAKASAAAATGNASETKEHKENLFDTTAFTAQGGDTVKAPNPPAWAPTVYDPANWGVIEMYDMRPTIDLLPPDLKQQVLDVWNRDQAILDSKELSWKDGQGILYPNDIEIAKAMMQQNGGFVVAMRQCGDHSWSWVELISSDSRCDPKEGDHGTAAGVTHAHKYEGGDCRVECNSICLPVPQGGSFKTKFECRFEGRADARLIFVPSTLHFSQWQCLSSTQGWEDQKSRDEDGFLFVSIRATNECDHGGVKGLINGKEIAGSYVHMYHPIHARIDRQSFCIPVPAGAKFGITRDRGWGNPEVCAYWIALKDTPWRMQETVSRTENTQYWAETDGILHGWIEKTSYGDGGTLKLYTGDDAVNDSPKALPCAAASMYYQKDGDPLVGRFVAYSSVMLPVAKGTSYKAVFSPSSKHHPQVQVYWTAISPR